MRGIILVVIIIAISICFVGCTPSCVSGEDNKLVMNISSHYMVKGEQIHLIVKASGEEKVEWSSSDDKVATIKNGLVIATSVGECVIAAKSEKGGVATSKIRVCDSMVSFDYNQQSAGFGIFRFKDLSVAAARGGDVVVMSGDYPVNLVLDISTKISGVGDVKILSVAGSELVLDNISILSNGLPQDKESMVRASKSLVMRKCNVIASSDERPEDINGGSGVYIGEGVSYVNIMDCSFATLNRAIVVERNSGEITIKSNRIMSSNIGIDVNVRGTGEMLDNYQTSGTIEGNIYISNNQTTKFGHNGAKYEGKLDFFDHSSVGTKPKSGKE